mmetsp:Transcript_46654/g.87332  ORF Transcript_46654/g.87332 Transcript_46654/m.87332 type:complete len:203 (+) Transcript_46654:74-682(+)
MMTWMPTKKGPARENSLEKISTVKMPRAACSEVLLLLGQAGVICLLICFCLGICASVEVLQLLEVLSCLNEPLDCRRVLPLAVPTARSVTLPVSRICSPLFRFLGHVQHSKNSHQIVRRCVCLFIHIWIGCDVLPLIVTVKLKQRRLCHHLCRVPFSIEAELSACRIAWADIRIYRIGNPCHVWRFCEVIPTTACPNQHVIC